MKRLISILLISLFLTLFLGVLLFARNVRFLASHSYHGEVDLIVVLTGASGRINEGVRLLEEGKAPRLLITGVEAASLYYLNAPEYDIKKLREENKLLVDTTAKNTIENALEARDVIKELEPKVNKILLVTSTYHMPRAELIFKKELNSGIVIYLYPVKSINYDPDNWWQNLTSIKLLVWEFFKYLWYRLYL